MPVAARVSHALPARVSQTIEEMYDFRVDYNDADNDDVSISVTSTSRDNIASEGAITKRDVKKATQQLMRTLVTLTQTLKVSGRPRALAAALVDSASKAVVSGRRDRSIHRSHGRSPCQVGPRRCSGGSGPPLPQTRPGD